MQYVWKGENVAKYSPYRGNIFGEKQPFRVYNKDKPKETMVEVNKKKNSFHNCESTDHYTNKLSKAKKKLYAYEKVTDKEIQAEDSESDSMGYSIKENCDYDHGQIEKFLVDYQEEAQLEAQEIQLEAELPQENKNKSLCHHIQDSQTFLVTPTKGMDKIHGTATNIAVFIDNAQYPLIIKSGAHFSIVARKYLDKHSPN
ncbi:hypothetical protein O181_048581 [Austropuccinia psidii MF-1]|uniref:Uncharacterized protein n=1 Tax=Austropuccinia psidii MF-1 TaxID=1389203 RepID=A0A9Q3DY96_9BASI|nr:hypothetical protein [Austropuccinia psidii MF-1]